MKTAKFSAKPSRKWIAALIWLPLLGANVFTVYYSNADLRGVLSSAGEPGDAIIWLKVALAVLAIICFLLAPVLMVSAYSLNGPDRNFLLLDRDGLSYMRAGKSRHWRWSELPAFKPVLSYRQVQFVLPGADAESARRDPWFHGVTPAGPVVAIRDIYDAPFDEVAAKLNEFRDRALGDGVVAG